MVRFMAMVLPALVSLNLLEKLEKKEYTGLAFFKVLGRYMLWINFISVMIVTYVLKVTDSIFDSFASNEFLIHYLMIAVVCAIVLPIIVVIFEPHFNIHKRKIVNEEEKNEKEN